MDFLRQKRGQSMRTARLFALAVACALPVAGASLLRSSGMSLSALNFIGPLRADPQQGDGTSAVPVAPDPAHPTPASGASLPDFVPGPHALSNSARSEPSAEEPEGQSQGQPLTTSSDGTTTGSVTTPTIVERQHCWWIVGGSPGLDQGRADTGNRAGEGARLAAAHRSEEPVRRR